MNEILILDIETTGFLNTGGKIVEIGIVSLDMITGETKIIFDKVCHETGITEDEVSRSWIVKNSSITVEEVRNSKNLNTMKAEIQEILNKYTNGCTAFNNAFDYGFMEDRGFVFMNKLPCPMKVSTDIVQAKNKRGGLKWPNVEEAYDFFFPDNNYTELHRGADDAKHEAEIVFELYKRGIFTLN